MVILLHTGCRETCNLSFIHFANIVAAADCNTQWFNCLNGKLVSNTWKCDGSNDCEDNSDELACGKIPMYEPHYIHVALLLLKIRMQNWRNI